MYEFKVAATKKATKKTVAVTGKYSKVIGRYYQTVKTNVKAGKSQAKVSWVQDKKASGYVVLVSTNKKMTNPKLYTVKGGKKIAYTVKSLKKGKTYYVAVRPYISKSGVRYDGVSSAPKAVKIK